MSDKNLFSCCSQKQCWCNSCCMGSHNSCEFDYNIYNSPFDGLHLEVWDGNKIAVNYKSTKVNQWNWTLLRMILKALGKAYFYLAWYFWYLDIHLFCILFILGVFYGHADMVFCFLYNLWWSLWNFASPWWGKKYISYQSNVIMVSLFLFLTDSDIGNAEKQISLLASCIQCMPYPTLIQEWSEEKKWFLSKTIWEGMRFSQCNVIELL